MRKTWAVLFATIAGLFADPVSDFKLVDSNLTSPSSGQEVSPRDYQHQVGVYYFGAAT